MRHSRDNIVMLLFLSEQQEESGIEFLLTSPPYLQSHLSTDGLEGTKAIFLKLERPGIIQKLQCLKMQLLRLI